MRYWKTETVAERPESEGRPTQQVYRPMMRPGPNAAEWNAFHAVVRFCRRFGPAGPRPGIGAFADWPEALVEDYVLFHLRQQTLVWVMETFTFAATLRNLEERCLGVGFAWPEWREKIEACTGAGRCVFDWTPADADADSVYLAEWVVRPDVNRYLPDRPVPTRREALRNMARTLYVRWPGQRGKPIFYHRGGQCKRLDGRLLGWAGLACLEGGGKRTRQTAPRKELMHHG